MVSSTLSPGVPRRLLPLAAFITAFTLVMTILFLSFDLKVAKPREFNFTQDLDFSSVGQDNPQFIAYVRAVHLQSPLPSKKSFEMPKINPQSLLVARLLDNKVNGSFVEAGAYGHGKPSSTEWLEVALGWRGLLIQADPWDFLVLRHQKRNKSTSVHACLSPTQYPKEVTFRQVPGSESLTGGHPTFTRVKCFPLFSLLLAANMTKIDYLSLDAEGAEIRVLKTLPMDLVEIKVISVEKKADESALMKFMTSHRYKLIETFATSYVFELNITKEQTQHVPPVSTSE